MQLYILHDDVDIYGICLTELLTYPKLKSLRVVGLSGQLRELWQDGLDSALSEFAKLAPATANPTTKTPLPIMVIHFLFMIVSPVLIGFSTLFGKTMIAFPAPVDIKITVNHEGSMKSVVFYIFFTFSSFIRCIMAIQISLIG